MSGSCDCSPHCHQFPFIYRGYTAIVVSATLKSTGERCALKIIQKQSGITNHEESVEAETYVLTKVSSDGPPEGCEGVQSTLYLASAVAPKHH